MVPASGDRETLLLGIKVIELQSRDTLVVATRGTGSPVFLFQFCRDASPALAVASHCLLFLSLRQEVADRPQ